MTQPTARVGIIGGSGLYDLPGLRQRGAVELRTPFGAPSDAYRLGELEGVPVAFLARHGEGHRLLPSEINYRANVFGFKLLGVERILSLSAVGSMREDIHPLDIVLIDQFFDRTRLRPNTFFGEGIAAHVAFADPVCPELTGRLAEAAAGLSLRWHRGGTYVCMEGPAFSTRAESQAYRQMGVSVIGMTNLPEAKLAREAEICYATVALVTDYDCWHEVAASVSVEAVVENLHRNAEQARELLRRVTPTIPPERTGCSCGEALKNAIITAPGAIAEATRKRLAPLIGRYLPPADAG